MKIFAADFLFDPQHRTFNTTFVEAMCENAEVVAVDNGKNFFKERISKAEILTLPSIDDKCDKPLKDFFSRTKRAKEQFKLYKQNKSDKIIILAYCEWTFGFSKFCRKASSLPPIFLVQHANVDYLADLTRRFSKIKRFLFKRYMNKVNHIVLEDFVKDCLVNNLGVEEKRVFVVRHPMRPLENSKIENSNEKSDEKTIVGLSQSNDSNLVKEITDNLRKTNFLEENKLKLILRSGGGININENNVVVRSERYAKDEYNELFSKANKILLPFSLKYKYRISGSLFDAVSFKKRIIASNTLLFSEFSKKYPSVCKIFTSMDDLLELLLSDENDCEEFERQVKMVEQQYGYQNTVKQLRDVIFNGTTAI